MTVLAAKSPTARRAVRFELDEHLNVKCDVHEYDDVEDEDDGDGDYVKDVAARSSREEDLRRQKDRAAREAREYARGHPEYARALERLLNSPVHPPSMRASTTDPDPSGDDLLALIGAAGPVRGLEAHCTPALTRHRKWATQTVLHVHRQQVRQRRDAPGVGGDNNDDEHLLLLRRSCEFVSRGAGELAVAIGAADAWAVRNEVAPR